jgi:hypothetical protein
MHCRALPAEKMAQTWKSDGKTTEPWSLLIRKPIV